MCDLYGKIELLCKNKGIKIAELSRETEINKTLFSDLKREKTKSLSLDKLIKIADYFEVSLDDLVGRKKITPDDKSSEVIKEIIKLFSVMSAEQQALYLSLAQQLILQGSKE